MTTTDMSSGSDAGAKTRAQETASTAKDEGKHVAGVAKEQASQVASEAAAQAKNVVNEAMTQVSVQMRDQGGTQRDKLVATLSTLGDDLTAMADQASPGLAHDLTRQVADQARSLTSRLDGREPSEILEDVRGFARQRPGLFLLGSLAAGVVVGRLLAGARDGIAGAAAAQPENDTTSDSQLLAGAPEATTSWTAPGQPTSQPSFVHSPAPAYDTGGLSSEGRP